MYCPKCGKELKQDDFNVCPYCGYDLHQPIQHDDDDDDDGNKDVIRLGWLKAIAIVIGLVFVLWGTMNFISGALNLIAEHTNIFTPSATSTSSSTTKSSTNTSSTATSTSKDDSKRSSYEGYIRANSFVCADMDTLLQLSDALKSSDKELLQQVILSGKAYGIKTRTKATIIPSLVDSNVVSVVIEEGKYDLKEGYTFTSWTESR